MSANLSRRSFIAGSAAMGGMMLGVSSSAEAKVPSKWDFKADVIVVGAGAAGIPAAIRAVEQGLSVLVVDANYDIGGHAIISQGNTLLGGGNAMQQKYGIKDSPETVFKDLTGARRENLESYIKRLEKLEEVASSFEGVERCFAIQAGREVRIMVKPEVVDDDQMILLARDICRKIESDLEYPGQIKVNMVRESRAVEYAK